ncbi:MAG: hypothetical protein ACJ8NR_08545 [Sulfurifustis sp.]
MSRTSASDFTEIYTGDGRAIVARCFSPPAGGVMEQWRRWCLDPEYAVGAEADGVRALCAEVHAPIVSLSFTDDESMSAWSIDSLHGSYANAARTMKRFAPQDVGERRIGHFGFFRPTFERSLWRPHLLPELT